MSKPPEWHGEVKRHGLLEPPVFSADYLRQRSRAGAEKRGQEQQRKFELGLAQWMEEFQEESEIAADQGESKCTLKVHRAWRGEMKRRLTEMGFEVYEHEDEPLLQPRITVSWG